MRAAFATILQHYKKSQAAPIHARATANVVKAVRNNPVSPRRDQARVFSHTRLIPCLEHSPLIHRLLWGRTRRRPSDFDLTFVNGRHRTVDQRD
jgi:hypothetical protein